MRMLAFASLAGVVIAAACLGAVRLTEDPPIVKPPRPGNIQGVISPADKVASVMLMNRPSSQTFPAEFDKPTGRFIAKGLPGDAVYDVWIKTVDGRNIQGIDLSFTDERLLRLGVQRAEALGIKPPKAHKFSADDANSLMDYVASYKSFENIHRPLFIQGNGGHATMLIELMRTTSFINNTGSEVTWRVELWYFEWNYGGWERVKDTENVILRFRVNMDKWRDVDYEYYPELSVAVSPEGAAKGVEFKIPQPPDPSHGRVAHTDPKQKIEPYISGVEVRGDEDAEDDSSPASTQRAD